MITLVDPVREFLRKTSKEFPDLFDIAAHVLCETLPYTKRSEFSYKNEKGLVRIELFNHAGKRLSVFCDRGIGGYRCIVIETSWRINLLTNDMSDIVGTISIMIEFWMQ